MTDTRERFCPHCGRANPASMPRCINCGQRMAGGKTISDTASAAVRGVSPLQFAAPEETESTLRAPWWQTGDTSAIPPPPQVRDEARRHALRQMETSEREAQNRTRYSEYLHEREKLQQARVAAEQELDGVTIGKTRTAQISLTHCPGCGTELGEAGKTFSFCLHCGQDVLSAAESGVGQRVTAQRTFAQAAPTGRVSPHAVHTAAFGMEGRTETRYTETAPRAKSSVAPGVAGVLSFFLPGVGQILNGQTSKGVLMLLMFLVLVPLLHVGFLGFLVQGAAAMDAYRIAQRRRDGDTVREDEWDLGRKR